MNDDTTKDLFSRRKFLESSSAAIAAAGMLASDAAAAQGEKQPYPSNDERKPYPTKDDRSSSAPGPGNPEIDAQNPDSFLPPPTDAGGVQAFKYPFGIAHKRMQEGGWSREVTVRELPISKTIAGVDMRLTAGGVRELHWHTAGEWAIMLYGNARITGLDSEGKSFVDDVGEGDLWYFPTGIPHSIQGLKPDGAEFLLVFDDGNFSEYETVLLTDWMAHTPKDVLAQNFGVSEQSLKNWSAGKNLFFRPPSPARSTPTAKPPQAPWASRPSISVSAPQKCPSPSAPKAAKSASSTPPNLKFPPPWPPPSSPSTPAASANSIGTRTPTNGNTSWQDKAA
jgi:oxalate decarboxylase